MIPDGHLVRKWTRTYDGWRSGPYSIRRFKSGMRGSALEWIVYCGNTRIDGPCALGRWHRLTAAKAACDHHSRRHDDDRPAAPPAP